MNLIYAYTTKINTLFIFLIASISVCFSQNNNDTIRINELLDKIEKLESIKNHDTDVGKLVEKHTQEIFELYEKIIQNKNPELRDFGHKVYLELKIKEVESKFIFLRNKTELTEQINNINLYVEKHKMFNFRNKVDLLYGYFYTYIDKKPQKAIYFGQRAEHYSKKNKDTLTLNKSQNLLATSYLSIKLNGEAIKYLEKVISNEKDKYANYGNKTILALIYTNEKQYKKAEDIMLSLLNEAIIQRFESDYLMNIYLRLFKIKLLQKRYDAAFSYIKKAEELNKKSDDQMFSGRISYAKGLYFSSTNQYSEALIHYKAGLKFYERKNIESYYIKYYYAIAKNYYFLDSLSKKSINKEFKRSISLKNDKYLDSAKVYAIKASERINLHSEDISKENIFALLKKIYLNKKNYEKAYQMLELEMLAIDSTNNFDNKINFIKNELQYNFSQKRFTDSIQLVKQKIKIESKIKQERSEKIALYIGLLALVLLLLLGYFRYKYLENKKDLILQKQETLLEAKQKEIIITELEFLKAQINPHFLFNIINTIYFKISKSNTDARDALMGFSEILRYQLYECNQENVPIENEIKYLKEYVRLQLLRKPENTICNTFVDENTRNFNISPLLLIPFVENSFKYLSNHKNKNNVINIILSTQNNQFIFEIENDYIKTVSKEENAIKKGGIGIKNVKRRLNLLYPNKHQLNIFEQDSVYKIQLVLNII